jgi:hypothetical protein
MCFANQTWAAHALDMQVNPKRGPDLIDDKKVVEVKFTLFHPDRYRHLSWRVLDYQMTYGEDNKAYWALGLYNLNRPIANINTKNPEKLEEIVEDRTLYIVEWDWMKQFPPYHQKGKTKISEWDHHIRFPKRSKLPKVARRHKVDKGQIMITKGVSLKDFNLG